MDLLDTIRAAVLAQKEEEALNFFSRVTDFREFVVSTRPSADALVALKMCCIRVERLDGAKGTRVTLVDAERRITVGFRQRFEKPHVIQVVIWDDVKARIALGKANITFRVGAVFLIRQIEFVGVYDGIAKGSVQFENGDEDKVRELGPPLRRHRAFGDGSTL